MPEWAGTWMLAMKSSANCRWPWADTPEPDAEDVFRRTYPAIHAHMTMYEAELRGRKNQTRHWWELSGSNNWDAFDRPKLLYPDLCWRSYFCVDRAGTLSGDTSFLLPVDDSWLLGVLNSPPMWAFMWRNVVHGKDETLRLKSIYMAELPIPAPTDAARADVETLVARLIDLKADRTGGIRAVLDWLRGEFGVDKPTQKLTELVSLSADELVAEVKKFRPKKVGLSVAEGKRLRDEYAASVMPLQANARESLTLERRVSDHVNAAFGLTPADVALMWATAPPRMPLPPPGK